MHMELRPLSLGEILDRGAHIYRSNFLLFVGIAAVPTAVLVGLGLVGIAAGLAFKGGAPSTALVLVLIPAVTAAVVAYAVLAGVSLAATNRAVSDLYLARPATIAGAYKEVRPHWFRYVWLMFVAVLYAWAPAVIALTVFAGGIGLTVAETAGRMPQWVGGSVLLLLFVATVPFSVWMTLRYALCLPASVFEDTGIHASLRRSVLLTKGGRWRVLLVILLVGVVRGALTATVQWVLIIAGVLLAGTNQAHQTAAVVVGELGGFAVNTLLGPIYGIAIALLYYDERIRKEGFDIEWMMQRANLAPAAPPYPEPGGLEAGAV